jgi:tripartite-type tricarboxylate transporter receptor subunit TctC
LGTKLFVDSGIDATMVDIGGKSEQLAALLGDQVDIACLTYAAAKEYVDSGEFIAIGYFGPENPNVDSTKYPALLTYGLYDDWAMNYSVFAPKGTDPAIIKLLSETIGDIVANDADYAQRIAEAYYQTPTYYDGPEGVEIFAKQAEILTPYVDELKG